MFVIRQKKRRRNKTFNLLPGPVRATGNLRQVHDQVHDTNSVTTVFLYVDAYGTDTLL